MSGPRRLALALSATVLLLAGIGPLVAPSPVAMGDAVLQGPSAAHWLGTDPFGRDVFARLAHGARTSLLVATLATAIAGGVGVLIGLLGGGVRGILGIATSRMIELALAVPRVVVLLVLVAATGRLGPVALGVVLGATGWPAIARLVRGEALRLAHATHVLAATALGASPARRLWREILPGALPPAIVALTLGLADVILLEAGLAYLGIGIRPPTPTWGTMILEAQPYLADAPWLLFAPSVALVAATAAATLLGDPVHPRERATAR